MADSALGKLILKKKAKKGKEEASFKKCLALAKKDLTTLEGYNGTKKMYSTAAAQKYAEAEQDGQKKAWPAGYAKLQQMDTIVIREMIDAKQNDEAKKKYEPLLAKTVKRYHKLMADDRGDTQYSTGLKGILDTARKHATDEEWHKSVTELNTAEEKYKDQVGQAKSDRSDILEVARYKPVYLAKLGDVQIARAKLDSMPGTQEYRTLLDKAMDTAKVSAGKGEFLAAADALPGSTWNSVFAGVGDNKVSDFCRRQIESANKSLEKIKNKVGGPGGLPGLMKKAEEEATAFDQTAGGSKKIEIALLNARNALTEFTDVAGVAFVGDAEKANVTIGKALVQMEDKKNEAAVEKELGALTKTLTERTKAMKGAKGRAEGLLKEMNTTVGVNLLAMTAPSVYQTFGLQLSAAQSLVAGQQYETAETALTKLKEEADKEVQKHQTAYKAWVELKKQFPTWRALVARPDQEKVFVPRELAIKLKQAMDQMEKAALEHDFAEVVSIDAAAKTATLAADFTKLFEKFKEATSPPEKGKQKSPAAGELEKAQAEADMMFNRAKEAIEGAKKAGADDTPLNVQLKEMYDWWGRFVMDALKSTEKEPFKTARAAMSEMVRRFEASVNELLNDKTGKLTASKETRVKRDQHALYATDLDKVTADLRDLAVENPAVAQKFDARLADAKKILANDPTAGIDLGDADELDNLRKEIAAEFLKLKQAGTQAVRVIAGNLKLAEEELKALTKQHGDFKGYLQTLSDRIEAVSPMAASPSPGVQKAAVTALEKLRAEMRAAGPDMVYIESKLESTKVQLEKDEVKKCRPSDQAALLKRRDTEIKDAVRSQLPAEGRKVIDTFVTEVTAVADDALAKSNRRTTIENEVKRLKKEVEKLKKSPKLKAHFENQLKAAEKPGEGEEAKVQLDLVILDRKLKEALNGGDDRAAEQERELAAREFETEKARKEFEAALDVYDKTVRPKAEEAKKDTPSSRLDPARFEDMTDLAAEARKYAVQGQYILATEKLKTACESGRDFIDNPMGTKKTARDSLPKVNAQWKQVVGEFLNKLSVLRTTLVSEAEQEPDLKDKKAVIGQRLDYAGGLFDAGKFEEVVKLLAADDTLLPANRRAKEQGMLFVRQYKGLLAGGNPVLDALRKHPTAPVTTAAIAERLNDMEFNLLRA